MSNVIFTRFRPTSRFVFRTAMMIDVLYYIDQKDGIYYYILSFYYLSIFSFSYAKLALLTSSPEHDLEIELLKIDF